MMSERAAASSFGELLRGYRAAAGLSQEQLAERAGLSARAVSDLERGARRAPYPHTIAQLAAALGLAAAERADLEASVRRRRASRAASDAPAPTPRHNLPAQLTSFVGREREVADVVGLLDGARLVTLAGAGGTGKTRLALAVAAGTVERYPDGVRLVELAGLAEPALVPQAMAAATGVTEEPGGDLAATLVAALRERALLLVLDNCEHLLDACAALADALLRGCPGLRLLATSREPLRLAGEVVRRVPPLGVPAPAADHDPAAVAASEAGRLFLERARAADPAFALTPAVAPAVGALCRRLDGLPLALELAAARVPALAPAQLAARLGDRFRLLVGGSRAAATRQQTLRAAVDWSHALLSPAERALFARLAVFAGGWTLEAAEAVGAGEGGPGDDGLAREEVAPLLARLVEQSLVVAEPGEAGEARYRLLETLRQYAAERLAEGRAGEVTRRRHADYYLALATEARAHLWEAGRWARRLETEHDNLRAALAWAIGGGAADLALRLAGQLWLFWVVHHHFGEGRRWLEAALALPAGPAGPAPPAVRAEATDGLAAMVAIQGDAARARALYAEALALARAGDDPTAVVRVLGNWGFLEWTAGELDRAAALTAEGVQVARSHADVHLLWILGNLALIAVLQADYGRAAALAEEQLARARAHGAVRPVAAALHTLAEVALGRGELPRARGLLVECLGLGRDEGLRDNLDLQLESVAALAAAEGTGARAARLLGAVAAWRRATGVVHGQGGLGPLSARRLAAARAATHEAAWSAAWAAGEALSLEAAVDEALAYLAAPADQGRVDHGG